MRFYSAALVSAFLSSALLTGCLPAYNGKSPNDAGKSGEDLAEDPQIDLAGVDLTPPPVLVDGGSTGTLSITLDKPGSSLRLNETMVINVTITPNGQTGSAALSLASAPTGVTATFVPPTVTLGAAPVTSVMTVTAASSMTPVSNIAAAVTATVGTNTSTTTYGVTVIPKLVIHIPAGTNTDGSGGHKVAGFPKNIPVTLPANNMLPVDFYNDDSVEHEIHADGNSLGMSHEPGSLTANGGNLIVNGVDTGLNYYETNITKTGTAKVYCHLHGGTATSDPGTIVVTQ
jgi:hypothetical protein